MRVVWLVLLAACGGGASPPAIDVTTSFPVTRFSGNGPSPLDPLQGQVIDLSIHWDQTAYNTGDGSDPAGCTTLTIGYGPSVTTRTAHGATAQLVQSEILDRLDNWDIVLQLCAAAGQSSVTMESSIDELNTTFGCFGIPAAAMRTNRQGKPELTSFTATGCSSTILDVTNNRVLGNDNFTMTITTTPAQLP